MKAIDYRVPNVFCLTAVAAAMLIAQNAYSQDYIVERVMSGLDRPTYVTQAPGDHNTLYIVEQHVGSGTTGAGFGRIRTLDLTTGVLQSAASPFLTINGIDTTLEGGVHTMAFHPDFQSNGKLYVAWLEDGGVGNTGANDYGNVDEYQVGGVATLSKRVFRYQLCDNRASHGLDWIGFDPTATGDARNYLHITTGDGGFDNTQNGAANPYSQDPSTPFGKMFRVDVRGDDFPGDADRNFAIPTTNPFYNDGDANTLDEVLHSGLRNPWRASFDRQTGDLFIGDVGAGDFEEINFVGASETGLVDFGWPRFEGLNERGTGFAGVTSRNPAHITNHSDGNHSITGGYVYRGPSADLLGKYIFGDYVSNRIWAADFDPATDPSTFNGANFTNVTEISALLESLVDGGASIDLIVSFGEDNLGNVYLVDFADGNAFNPAFDTGEIFRIVLAPEPTSMALLGAGAMLLLRRRRVK